MNQVTTRNTPSWSAAAVLSGVSLVLGAIGETLVPSAQAADLTASSNLPAVDFEIDVFTGNIRAARLQASTPLASATNEFSFELQGRTDSVTVIDIDTDLDGDQSIAIDENGDIGLADNSVFIDRSADRLGIGTAIPLSPLHVSGAGGDMQILVEEISPTTANRRLLQLTNNGRAQVRLSNTATGVNWVTGMGTDDAYIIRRGSNEYRFTKGGRVRWFLAGTPQPIFDFNNNGNLKIAGTLTENSDVNAKRDIEPVDGQALLDRVAALPVSTWSYREDEAGARHIGPMAQDFHAAFALGAEDTSISPRDVAGVALAGLKALQEVVRRKDAEIAALTARLAAVEARLAALD